MLAFATIMHVAAFVLTLFIFWLLLSGIYTPFLVTAGLGSAIVIALMAQKMKLLDREGFPVQLLAKVLVSYWPWLLVEIMKSAWAVTKCILSPRLPISPTLIEFVPTQKTDLGLVIHANSITLTPGTISVEVEPGRFLVHALTREGASGLADSEMDRRCTALEQP